MVPSLPLTEDDAFGSHPQLGMLNYRLPSLVDLFDMPYSVFNEHNVMRFTLHIRTPDGTIFTCETKANCDIHYKRSFTPIVTHFTPPVVFSSSLPDIWFDPKNVMALLGDIPEDDLPFINLKLDESLLNFENRVDSSTTFRSYTTSRIRGEVGELDNGNKPVKFLWETGRAHVIKETAMVCTYDESDCYYSKVVPVIFSTSEATGYTTGGQEMVIKGYGFKGQTLKVTIDGQPCKISANQTDEIRCIVASKNTPSVTGIFQGQMGLVREVY